jgi:hypothetical protein
MSRVSITVRRLVVLLHFADRACLGTMQSRIFSLPESVPALKVFF